MLDPAFHIFSDAPKISASDCHAVEAGDFLFVSGQRPILADGSVPEGIEAQTAVVFENLRLVIERAGFGGGTIVGARVFMTKLETQYERMNAIYITQFPVGKVPARTCVGVTALPGDCQIEIDVTVKRA